MRFEVRAATDADRGEVIALVREMSPEADAEARVAWLYDRNPAGRALTWIAAMAGEVVGCTSFFPFRMQLDGAAVLGALGGDGYVRPDFRRQGVGALLHDASRGAMTAHGIACMYGAPGAMNITALEHGGSREVDHVARWLRPLRGRLGAGIRALERLVLGLGRRRSAARLDPMAHGDPRLDAIWRAAGPALRLAAVRDAAFYTWRFLDAPAHREPPYVIVSNGRPIAACALEMIGGGADIRIIDLVATPGAWHVALSAIARHAAGTNARTLDIKLMRVDGRRRQMWRSGFVEREGKPFLVMVPPGGDPRFLDPSRWFYCGGDSDLDALV